ncbi:2,3-dihydroxybenzoate-AMP ligase, partial [Paenibacillus sepulcri]|nr:2,3-dihydroxybenzoate-AMP ligase [Paenibacillus sepulcri]
MFDRCPAWPEEFARRYKETGCWQGETFGELLRVLAVRHGDRTAIVCGDSRMSYGELDARAGRLAAGFLELGI